METVSVFTSQKQDLLESWQNYQNEENYFHLMLQHDPEDSYVEIHKYTFRFLAPNIPYLIMMWMERVANISRTVLKRELYDSLMYRVIPSTASEITLLPTWFRTSWKFTHENKHKLGNHYNSKEREIRELPFSLFVYLSHSVRLSSLCACLSVCLSLFILHRDYLSPPFQPFFFLLVILIILIILLHPFCLFFRFLLLDLLSPPFSLSPLYYRQIDRRDFCVSGFVRSTGRNTSVSPLLPPSPLRYHSC